MPHHGVLMTLFEVSKIPGEVSMIFRDAPRSRHEV